MKKRRFRLEFGHGWIKRTWVAVRAFLCLAAIVATVIGCGWYGPIDSVRFNDYLKGHDFFRLPPLPMAINGVTGKPVRWYETTGDDRHCDADCEKREQHELEVEKQQRNEAEACWLQANEAEQRGDWGAMRRHLSRFLELGGDQARCNSAQDRLDVLQSLAQGASVNALRAYLAVRADYDNQYGEAPGTGSRPLMTAEALREQLDRIRASSPLQDNVAYLCAALLYKQANYVEAEQAFRRLAARYPHSEKREAALLMAALATMKQSCSFEQTCKDAPPNTLEDAVPCESCRDVAWKRARQSFLQLLNAYPRGRYATEARGWLGYLARLSGDRAGALVEYYRQLAEPDGKFEAVFSLSFVRRRATAAEMERVENELADEPAAALAYAYHNLYNHAYAIEPGPLPYYRSEQEQKEDQLHRAEARRERERVAAFATRLLRRYPQANLSGAFTLRVAEANLELGEYKSAREMAARALNLRISGEERKQALWVKGASEHYLNDYTTARQTLTALITADHDGDLTEGARRMLAITAERAGDFDTALEQYFVLGYNTDVAYLVDVLLTPPQLADFIARHPQAEQRNQLIYALGVRHLREGQWNDARAALVQVQSQSCNGWYSSHEWRDGKRGPFEPKSVTLPDQQIVCTEWVLRDLKTIDDLERLERYASLGPSDEAKAEALYQFASYQYEGGTMLFYNAQAWHGWRHELLSDLAARDAYLLPNEARKHWEAAQSHDALARSLKIYLEVAQRFPPTRAARDALYTAAVCHERLANMNNYWRGIYDRGLFAGARLVTYRDVKRAYPNYRFPLSNLGWQPMTRTVNGGPAWDAPPKPRPRLTFSQRVRWKTNQLWQHSVQAAWDFWSGRLQPLLLSLFLAVCCVAGVYAILVSSLIYRQQLSLRLRDELILVNLRIRPELTEGEQSPVERIINDS